LHKALTSSQKEHKASGLKTQNTSVEKQNHSISELKTWRNDKVRKLAELNIIKSLVYVLPNNGLTEVQLEEKLVDMYENKKSASLMKIIQEWIRVMNENWHVVVEDILVKTERRQKGSRNSDILAGGKKQKSHKSFSMWCTTINSVHLSQNQGRPDSSSHIKTLLKWSSKDKSIKNKRYAVLDVYELIFNNTSCLS
jgi:hypothetical protein